MREVFLTFQQKLYKHSQVINSPLFSCSLSNSEETQGWLFVVRRQGNALEWKQLCTVLYLYHSYKVCNQHLLHCVALFYLQTATEIRFLFLKMTTAEESKNRHQSISSMKVSFFFPALICLKSKKGSARLLSN